MPFDVNRTAPAVAEQRTVIEAPRERVWLVLTQIDSWPRWQKSVSRAHLEGALQPGSEFRWKTAGMSIASTLRLVEPPNRIGWDGHAPGIHARHLWTLESGDRGTIVRAAESFEGRLVRLLRPLMQKQLQKGLDEGRIRVEGGRGGLGVTLFATPLAASPAA